MIGAIIAWLVSLSIVGLIVAGTAAERREKRRVDVRQYAVPTDDSRVAEQTELQREHVETLVNRQQVGPGGL
jgi:hypothetical protein